MSTETVNLLLVGVSDLVANFATKMIKPTFCKRMQSCEEFLAFLDNPEELMHIVVVGSNLPEISVIEIAQSLRGIMLETIIFYADSNRDIGFDRHNFVKNGFTDAFLLPLDKDSFAAAIENVLVVVKKMPVFRPVKIVDLQAGDVLEFDLHVLLPANKKYIRYSTAGQSMSQERIEKLRSHNVGALFVPLDQMEKFHDYTAAKLKALHTNKDGLSETDRLARIHEGIRNLMTGIFTTKSESGFDDGKQMMTQANDIVKALVAQSDHADWYAKVLQTVGGESNSYSHFANVSTFAALFSIALGIGKPEEMALAGLFHDLGLSIVPAEIQMKDPATWTAEERAEYEKHPEHSVNLMKKRRISIPEIIQTMILQHHERSGGLGFPLKLSEPKLKRESQVLAIADEFDELTISEIGKANLTPMEALQKIKGQANFNLEILDKLMRLFVSAKQ